MHMITPSDFAVRHPLDRLVWPALLACLWLAMLMGFVPEALARMRRPQGLDYPLIVHLHAAAFVGWLVLLTTQVALVRSGRVALHRRLGVAGAGLAMAMLVLGPATSLHMAQLKLDKPEVNHGFFAITFTEMALFGLLVALALYWRRDSATHRRLMLIATFALASAGFGRWWGKSISAFAGNDWLGDVLSGHLGSFLLIAGLGVHDLLTRGRLHPAYVWGSGLIVSALLLAEFVRNTNWWPPIALAIVRWSAN